MKLSPEYRIRTARPADVADIMRLVRALADFEDLPAPDEGADARLVEHAFGSDRRVELLVAERDQEVVAYAAYFMTYSTFLARPSLYLEDLFVDPAHRRKGIATTLLRELARTAVGRGCGRFEWSVLGWNSVAQELYRSLGAEILAEWRLCRLSGAALAKLGVGSP